ncbi:von Willebrand factor type A domain protein [Marinomonas aquimarina]|uniref:von Willebrand factor type A domain protein n=1 Tax=Marinomonas aquimarina TaxID=295068 RepID=A0A1A8TB99_9GAMM|nr:VWA domain-containing protein [Marinomonas aquimarina]SBS30222.1 von Willebrand factor type A domain protein [Marinomonas aquimarina]
MSLYDWLHFNRPIWLLFIPIIWLLASLLTWQRSDKALKSAVAEHLIPYLTHSAGQNKPQKWLGLISVSLLFVGLSGISFSKTETELYSPNQKTVFIVDQSLSMYATDMRPNRLTREKQILRDILRGDLEGEMALIAYAGDAYVVSPFTQDRETLTHFLVALDPLIMPLYGSNLAGALAQAQQLIHADDAPYTSFVVLTDDIRRSDIEQMAQVREANISLEVISIGSADGATIQLPDGQILRHQGIPAIPKVPLEQIEQATTELGGHYYSHQASLAELARVGSHIRPSQEATKSQFSGITWQEQGHWFALPFLAWLLWQFRGGYVLMLLMTFAMPMQDAKAAPLDWFKTDDQKGQQAFNQGDWQSASQWFHDPRWKAASDYANEAYDSTSNTLLPLASSAADFYNLGNALALQEDLEGAANAYQEALSRQPDLKQAQENLDYIEQLLEQQAQEQAQQNQNQQNETSPPDNGSAQNDPSSSPENGEPESDKIPQKQDNNPQKRDNQSEPDTHSEADAQSADTMDMEQQQALEQWLRQIQDDPGTLLQRKLWYLHQERRNENRFNQEEGRQPW